VRIGVAIAALMGLCLAAYLIFYVGVGAVFSAAASVGWSGFAALCLYGLTLFALLGTAWFALAPPDEAWRISTFLWGRAVRDSAGEVLPFSQMGGFVVGVRAVMLRGVSAPFAFASTIVDVTMELIAQIVFVMIGIVILLARVPTSPSSTALADGVMLGIAVAMVGAGGFLVVQRRGLALVERLAARFLPSAAAQAGAVHRAVAQIHAAPLRLLFSFVVHLTCWIATAGWAWCAMRLMGIHAPFPAVVAIEALLYAIRSAAVFVPNAIGVQEAAYLMLFPLFGLPPPVGLAVSLLKRARDITVGIPVLLTWQFAEGGHALRESRNATNFLAEK
jgi:putative membrane protein